ncbi:MAG TPA: amidase family protein, partial [Paraburkholderia sp.]
IAGLRPTAGRVPSYTATAGEARPFSAQVMAVQGPLARNMRDIRLGLQAMSAGDPRDPTWVAAPLTWPTTRAPIRVALVDEIEGATVAPEVRAALAQAARWLEQEGYVVEHASLPQMREVQDVWMSIAMTDVRIGMLSAVDKFGDDAIRNAVHGMLDNAPVLDLNGYMQAIARRDALRRKWSVFLAQYPLILMPTSCQLPFQWGLDQQGPAVTKQILAAQSPMMAIAALSLPGLNVPTGLVGNVPVGVQLVAGSFREDLCITAGEAIERHAAMPKSYEMPSAA